MLRNTKVWVLKTGLTGFNAQGFPVTLQPGLPGWMSAKEAKMAQDDGSVQIMAGLRPQDLKTPDLEQPKPRRRRGQYRTTKMSPADNGDI